jgi:hypothetical protein
MRYSSYLVLFFICELLYGCTCRKPVCNPDFNAIEFTFDKNGTASSFTSDEVDTVYVIKLIPHTQTRVDSIMVTGKPLYFNETGFTFGTIGPYWFNDYKILTQSGYAFLITDLEIEATDPKDNCECAVNKVKKGKVNNIPFDLSGKSSNQSAVTLSK